MIRINIKLSVYKDTDKHLRNKIKNTLNIDEFNYQIVKKSIDARDKNNIMFNYKLDIETKDENKILKRNKNVTKVIKKEYEFKITGTKIDKYRPVIVGAGPSGLFAGYVLAENGYKPLIIEQGEMVEERIKTINEFWKTGNLNERCNIQFGEGGAGTFSDGKLNTLSKDKNLRMEKVFETFIKCGAPKNIMYESKPHIGTDILRKVIVNMRKKIISMGGEFRFNTKLTDIHVKNGKLYEIVTNDKDIIPCDNLFLCIGHSSRDTYKMLYKNGLDMKSKPFAVGLRIIHNQETINKSSWGENYPKNLGEASYKLVYHTKNNRGVYSFCMCPGGYVINASSFKNKLAINGMSDYARDSGFANSAIVAEVNSKDYGDGVFDGVKFQEKLEEKAYNLGNGAIPVSLYEDYLNNKVSTDFKSVKPVFKSKTTFANLNEIFPKSINEDLKESINYFGTKIKHFNDGDSVLAGVESRTSSPVRMTRDEMGLSNICGIYPVGEGAGYAGGITTASMDGIGAAENYAKLYKNRA